MSKIVTMQKIIEESEEVTFKRKDIDSKIKFLKDKILELHYKNLDSGAEKRFKNNQIDELTKSCHELCAERDNLKLRCDELKRELESIKKASQNKVQQVTGLESVTNLADNDKESDEIYNKKYAQKFEEWKKTLPR